MKKTQKLFLLAVATILIFASCSTTVTVSYMRPAKFNLAEYKNLAIATTEVNDVPLFTDSRIDIHYDDYSDSIFSGYDRRIPSKTATYYTDKVYKDLEDSSYFDIIPPAVTDSYIRGLRYGIKSSSKLYDMGADAIFLSSIDYLDYREYPVYGDYKNIENPNYVEGGTEPKYIKGTEKDIDIIQEAKIKMSYEIIDLLDGSTLASGYYTDSISNSIKYDTYLVLDSSNLFKDMVNGFVKSTVNDLVPKKVYSNLALMDNDPQNPMAQQAMDLVNSNDLYPASEVFLEAWKSYGHLPSGYNAALLLEALGDREEAMFLMKQVYRETKSTKALSQYSRMKEYQMSSDEANDQIEGF